MWNVKIFPGGIECQTSIRKLICDCQDGWMIFGREDINIADFYKRRERVKRSWYLGLTRVFISWDQISLLGVVCQWPPPPPQQADMWVHLILVMLTQSWSVRNNPLVTLTNYLTTKTERGCEGEVVHITCGPGNKVTPLSLSLSHLNIELFTSVLLIL